MHRPMPRGIRLVKKSKTGTIVHCYGRRYCRCRGIIAMSHANLHACMEANAKKQQGQNHSPLQLSMMSRHRSRPHACLYGSYP